MRHPASLVLVLLGLSPALAHAQTRDPVAAEALFVDGRAAMKRGDFASACPKFAESQRLDPAPGTVLNLAQCEEKVGEFASAWQHYREAADQLPPGDSRNRVARAGLASVERRVPKLTVRLPADAPPGTKVLRDDVELGEASLDTALPIDPGEHVIVTRAEGRSDHREAVVLRPGESKEITVALGEPAAEPASSTVAANSGAQGSRPAPAAPEVSHTGKTQRALGYVTGGVGVVGLGIGGYFALAAQSKKDDIANKCSGGTCPPGSYMSQADLNAATKESQDAARNATVAFVAGGALIVAGAVLVLAAPSEDDRSSVAVSGAFGPDVAGLIMGGAW